MTLLYQAGYTVGLACVGPACQADAYRDGEDVRFGRGHSDEQALLALLVACELWPPEGEVGA